MDLLEFRARVAQWEPELVKTLPPLPSGLVEEYIAIPPTQTQAQDLCTQPQSPSPSSKILKITRPFNPPPSTNTPLILLFHGGGFCAGSIEQLARPAREFAAAFGAIVVCASYALTPEHPFPAGVEDAYGTVLWVGRNAEEVFGVKLRGNSKELGGGSAFVVGGVSAGGNIAAALAPLVIARGELPEGVRITGSFLVIPRLLVEEIVPAEYEALWTSREENKDHSGSSGGDGGEGGGATGTGTGDGRPSSMMLTPSLVASMYTALNPDVRSRLFSPFNYATTTTASANASANSEEGETILRQLPRTYLQVGERDILRDDGVVYERFLRERGVEVKLDVNPGLGHVAYTVFMQGGGEVEESVQEGLKERTVEGMRWLLGM